MNIRIKNFTMLAELLTVCLKQKIFTVQKNLCFILIFSPGLLIYFSATAATPTTTIDSIAYSCQPYPDSSCTFSVNKPGISNVTFGSINNTTAAVFNRYTDYTCCKTAIVSVGATFPISVTTNYAQGEYIKVWIDYNSNGDFDADEGVLSGFANHTLTGSVTIPATIIPNRKLRMRITSDILVDSIYSCLVRCGESEDYAIVMVDPNAGKPKAGFSKTEKMDGCSKYVLIKNTSTGATSYSWDMGAGLGPLTTPDVSYTYSKPGTYTIALAACNAKGCDTARQTVTIDPYPTPVPTACPLQLSKPIWGLQSFKFDSLLYNTDMEDGYNNRLCRQMQVFGGATYTVTIINNWLSHAIQVWLDTDNDGIFSYLECIKSVQGAYSNPTFSFPVTIPSGCIQDTPLRMRIITSYYIQASQMCAPGNFPYEFENAQIDDYTVSVHGFLPAKASFTVNNPNDCTDHTLLFTNNSKNTDGYLWDFGDGTTSTQFEPEHAYTTPGTYTVKLKAYNGAFADSMRHVNYITILQSLPEPVIKVSGKFLTTDVIAGSYQWFRYDTLIAGAISPSYQPLWYSNYGLRITNSNGCETWSRLGYGPIRLQFNSKPVSLVCGPTSFYLENLSKNALDYTILWGDGSKSSYTEGAANVPVHLYAPGIYTVTLIGCNQFNQCDTLVKPNAVIVPDVLAQPELKLKQVGKTYELHANSKDKDVIYEWNDSNGLWVAGDSVYIPTVNMTYRVRTKKLDCLSPASAAISFYPLRADFPKYNVGICGDTSYTTYFQNNSINATTYLWNFGDGTTSTDKEPQHTFKPGIYTVSLKACSDTVCDSLIQINCIRLDDHPFRPKLSSPVQREFIFCSGFSFNVPMSTPDLPGYTYKWYNQFFPIDSSGSSTTQSTYTAVKIGYYLVQVTNDIGCSAFTDSVIISADPACVWPGDANNDAEVNNLDMIPIGLYYGKTGSARATVSNTYTAFYADDWGIKGLMGDIKHIDCNGDGIIDNNDTLAVNLNFNAQRQYSKPLPAAQGVFPPLYLQTSKTSYRPGEWVTANVILGNAFTPVDVLYGIAFNISYDVNLVDGETVSLTYPASWLGKPGTDVLTYSKTDVTGGTVYGAAVRTTHDDKSGQGKVADLHFRLKQGISQAKDLPFTLSSYAVEATADQVILYPEPYTIKVNPVITSLDEATDENNTITLYPNPFINSTSLSYTLFKKSDVKIEIYTVTGQLLETLIDCSQPAGAYTFEFNAKEKAYHKGIYLLKILIDGKTSVRRMVKLQ